MIDKLFEKSSQMVSYHFCLNVLFTLMRILHFLCW